MEYRSLLLGKIQQQIANKAETSTTERHKQKVFWATKSGYCVLQSVHKKESQKIWKNPVKAEFSEKTSQKKKVKEKRRLWRRDDIRPSRRSHNTILIKHAIWFFTKLSEGCGGMSCSQRAKLSILLAECTGVWSDSSQCLWRRCPGWWWSRTESRQSRNQGETWCVETACFVGMRARHVDRKKNNLYLEPHARVVHVKSDETTLRRVTNWQGLARHWEKCACGEVFCVHLPSLTREFLLCQKEILCEKMLLQEFKREKKVVQKRRHWSGFLRPSRSSHNTILTKHATWFITKLSEGLRLPSFCFEWWEGANASRQGHRPPLRLSAFCRSSTVYEHSKLGDLSLHHTR